jgi:hypothetical protein
MFTFTVVSSALLPSNSVWTLINIPYCTLKKLTFCIRKCYLDWSLWPAQTLGSWVWIPLEAWMSVCLFRLCCPMCAGSGLATGWSPSKKSYRLCKRLRNWKAAKVQQRAVEPQIDNCNCYLGIRFYQLAQVTTGVNISTALHYSPFSLLRCVLLKW